MINGGPLEGEEVESFPHRNKKKIIQCKIFQEKNSMTNPNDPLVQWLPYKCFNQWLKHALQAGVLALQLGDTLRSCTFISSRARNFKLYIKLVLCCRITRWCNKCRNEAPKMSNSWPKVRKKTEKIATKKRKQDHKEVSFRMTIFLFDSVLKEICKETLILVYV